MEAMPSGRPMTEDKQSSFNRLRDLQSMTRETVGILIDRLRPVMIQHPEAVPDAPPTMYQSGLDEMAADQDRILGMVNQILRDLDL